jgi:hypothetical protein
MVIMFSMSYLMHANMTILNVHFLVAIIHAAIDYFVYLHIRLFIAITTSMD